MPLRLNRSARLRRLADSKPQRPHRLVPPALRYPYFRRYWLGLVSSVTGFRMFQFAQYWLAYELTGSALQLGLVGLADAAPAITLNLLGGATADRLNKRRLVLLTELCAASWVAILLALVATEHVQPWHVLVTVAVVSALNSFNQPARLALYPGYVDRAALTSAVALNTVVWQGTRIVGPAVAGFVIAASGTETALAITCAGMVGMALVMRTLPADADEPSKVRGHPLRGIAEGLRFVRTHSLVRFLLGMTFFNSFFALSFMPLMPIFAVDVLGVGVSGQGLLLGTSGVGSLLVTVLLSTRASDRGGGVMLLGGAVLAGVSLTAFALTSLYLQSFMIALLLIFVVGMATSAYMVQVTTSLQLMAPAELRGRIMGLWAMTYNIMPLGAMFASVLAELVGVPWAVALGGLAVLAFALGPALLNPRIRALEQSVDELADQEG